MMIEFWYIPTILCKGRRKTTGMIFFLKNGNLMVLAQFPSRNQAGQSGTEYDNLHRQMSRPDEKNSAASSLCFCLFQSKHRLPNTFEKKLVMMTG